VSVCPDLLHDPRPAMLLLDNTHVRPHSLNQCFGLVLFSTHPCPVSVWFHGSSIFLVCPGPRLFGSSSDNILASRLWLFFHQLPRLASIFIAPVPTYLFLARCVLRPTETRHQAHSHSRKRVLRTLGQSTLCSIRQELVCWWYMVRQIREPRWTARSTTTTLHTS
jgi:hypothetical protein